MKNRIQDIETIQVRTKYNFSFSKCVDAYKESGEDVDVAVAQLNSTADGFAGTERKKGREIKRGGFIEALSAFLFFASLFTIIAIVILASIGSLKWSAVFYPLGVAIFSFIMFGFANATKKKLEAQSNEEYLKEKEKEVVITHDQTACPCCGSHKVQFFEPKFNRRKALLGTVISGSLLGAYFGVPKPGEYKAVCNHCGHHWKAKIK